MEIRYKNEKIKEICNNLNVAKKKFNKIVAEKLINTIVNLENAENLFDIYCIPNYRLHSLTGNRLGQYAIDLGKKIGYRLIIEPVVDDSNKNNLLEYYEKVKIIEVIEVSNHYE